MEKKTLDALTVAVSQGDESAFETLYEKTKRGVFAFAYSYLRNYADAEDALQETFITIKQKAYLYKPQTDARAWILQITKNLCLDELRKRKRRQESSIEREEPSVSPTVSTLDELTNILSEKEKEIVILHAVWDYKHREIAKMKGLPLGTVTWIYNTALKKLRKAHENEKEDGQ